MRTASTLVFIVGIITAIMVYVGKIPFLSSAIPAPTTVEPIATVTYQCSDSKTIHVNYFAGDSRPAPSADLPPVPGGSLELTLSDGRTMKLAQTISADGARYANADESIVAWNKGTALMFTENGLATYTNCLSNVHDPAD